MRHKLRFSGFILLFALLVVGGVSVLGQASLATWSPAQTLGDGWWNSTVVDRQGRIHIGWYDPINMIDSFSYASYAFDGTWADKNDVLMTVPCCWTVRNAMAVTSDGMLNVLYRHQSNLYLAKAPVNEASDATNWEFVSIVADTGYYLDMIADKDDVLHVVWSGRIQGLGTDLPTSLESRPCPYCSDLFYRQSTDGGSSWSLPIAISTEPDTGNDRPSVIQGDSGRLYIFWDEGTDWYQGRGQALDVRIVYSDDGGLSWSEPIKLAGTKTNRDNIRPIQIALTEMGDGSLMAVWRYNTNEDPHIYYQISNDVGETWTTPESIPSIYARDMNQTPLDDYELVTDLLGNLHLFVVGSYTPYPASLSSLFHIEYRQGRWRSPQVIYEGSNLIWPEWPRADVGPQNDLHVTWFNRIDFYGSQSETDDQRGKLSVLYSHRGPTLPQLPTQAFIPVPTATPQAAVIKFEVTATPFPTALPIERAINAQTNSDMYATQTLMLALVAGAMVCGGFAVTHRFLSRR